MSLFSEKSVELSDTEKKYSRTRVLYIIEAALEYFFYLLLTGAYIAKVASYIGISDATVGVLTQMSTFGCVFQLCALFIPKKASIKRLSIIFQLINQLFFTSVWLIPVLGIPKSVKIPIFVICLLGGWLINNVVNAPKISWYMSMVDDRKRGSFTANKEIVSLISGMVFTLVMSYVIDGLEAKGDLPGAFLVGGVTLLVITILHSVTLILSHEPKKDVEKETSETENIKKTIKSLIHNKAFGRVLIFTALVAVSNSCALPFYGTYQNNELGFSLLFISVIGIVHVVVRCLAAIFMGKYADKNSFAAMLNLAFIFATVGYLIMVFAVPSNGKIAYTVYFVIFAALFQSGYGNGIMNLVFDSVDKDQRTGAFSIYNIVNGLMSFVATLLFSYIVTAIQNAGNKVFGIPMYAQQFLSALAVIITLIAVVYLNIAFKKEKK